MKTHTPRRSGLLALLGGLGLTVWPHAAAWAQDGTQWHFTLPTLDGSRFVRLTDANGPVLVNFWGTECAPCVRELPRLAQFAKANPSWTVLLVSTDPPAQTQDFIERMAISLSGLTVLRGGPQVAALMRSAGNPMGALPYTAASIHNRVCQRHLGELDATALVRLQTQCVEARP